MKKQLLFHLLMFLLAFAVAFFLGELMLRIGGWATPRNVHTVLKSQYCKIPGMFEPNQSVWIESNVHLPFHVSINSVGFRGMEVEQNKNNVFKILCIGDSFTFGDFVDDTATYPYYLQKLCQQESQDTVVYNAGIGGTTLIDHFHFLPKYLTIQPDLVILNFTENDIEDLLRFEPMYVTLKKNREIKSSLWGKPLYFLIRNSSLFNFYLKIKANYYNYITLKKKINAKGSKNIFGNPNFVTETMSEKNNQMFGEAWLQYQAYLKNFAQYLKERSIPLIFVIFSGHYRMDEIAFEAQSPQHRLKRIELIAARLDLNSIDLLPVLQKSGYRKEQLYLLPYDTHPSPLTYRIAAREIFDRIQQ